MGADIAASAPSMGLPPDNEQIVSKCGARASFLMVGTVEPRKGHAQVVAAFERLWSQGMELNLVIIGKPGWMVESLIERLRSHREADNRLFYVEWASDQMLLQLYKESAALIMASEGEGFGLPLIEAAHHKLPIIARDLPVFKEVAGEYAYYFHGTEPDDLAKAIRDWIKLRQEGSVPDSSGMPWLTWQQSTATLLDLILGGKWDSVWIPKTKA
jgi:glycosyltransferase involved in cell wall biosynthesis